MQITKWFLYISKQKCIESFKVYLHTNVPAHSFHLVHPTLNWQLDSCQKPQKHVRVYLTEH